MQNNLYGAIKHRMFEEMNQSIQRHPTYAGSTKAYHRLHHNKERPQTGVLLRSVSSSRIKLSPDDHIGDLKSLVTLAKVGDSPGSTIEWVWEDAYNLTKYVEKEDVSATLDSTGRLVTVVNTPISAGHQNVEKASNFGQVRLYLDGVKVDALSINADTGQIALPANLAPGVKVEVSYYYSDMDKPGYYFVQFNQNAFNITPLYSEYNEVVIEKTTGTETEANLNNTPVLVDYVLNLTTKKNFNSTLIYLDREVDYNVDSNGLITFLKPLQAGTTLYASYRWQGENRGPFVVENENEYLDEPIKGVVLAVGSRKKEGDKQVVILNPKREQVAKVYGGHYTMNLDWTVFSRDPMTTEELADHLVSDIWSNRRPSLKWEGITIEECDAASETEEVYDDATGAMYFENNVTMQIMTEWKKFVPYILKLAKYNYKVKMYGEMEGSDIVTGVNTDLVIDLDIQPKGETFEVVYPKMKYPIFY